jgi:hypothetical protein
MMAIEIAPGVVNIPDPQERFQPSGHGFVKSVSAGYTAGIKFFIQMMAIEIAPGAMNVFGTQERF